MSFIANRRLARSPSTVQHPANDTCRGLLKLLLPFTMMSVLSLTGCDAQPFGISMNKGSSKSEAPIELPELAQSIDKGANLYQVDNFLFRSEQLRAADVPLIKANNINAIVSLRFFDQDEDQELLANVAEDADVTLYNQPLKSWHVTPKEIAQILQQIKELQTQNQRVLVHCYHGADRTGLIIAMYRIIDQGWSIAAAKQEMTAGGFGYHPIWVNLEKMLNPATVADIRQELTALQRPKQAA